MSSQFKPSFDKDYLISVKSKRFGIVSSEWNPEIINRLLDGAFDFFDTIGSVSYTHLTLTTKA